jgi:UDPglucose 6-dehydrogenase/GDP-mannose 6-dehydrogenase
MRISVIGTGYVGLVSGACLAGRGHEVICVDVDDDKVARINAGESPIHEAGLDDLLRAHVGELLRATTDLAGAIADTDLTLICVGTPSREGDIDLTQVTRSARDIGRELARKTSYHVVAVKSTVVPGTTDEVVRAALEETSGRRAGEDFGVGMNPEFLTEGQALADFMNPDRIVLGGMDVRTHDTLARVYESFEHVPVLRVNNRTAEMIKYASNAMLATQISFANEIAGLCSAVGGVDVVDVMDGVHRSHYLSPALDDGEGPERRGSRRVRAPLAAFLEAGCGFGGSCLPKDVTALVAQGHKLGVPTPVLEAVLETNARQPARMIELLERHVPDLTGVPVSVLGLAFKPDTDDMRESPALPIVRELLARGALVRGYDPVARETARDAFAGLDIELVDSLDEAVRGAEALLLVTRWAEFGRLAEMLEGVDPGPVVVDGRRVLDPRDFQLYEGIGRG